MNKRIYAAFDEVKASEELKARTLERVSAQITPRTRRSHVRRLAVAMASFLLVLLGAGSYLVYFTPTAAVSVDAESGLSLEVNRFDRVIGVSSYGQEGSELVSELNLHHLDCAEAVDRLLSQGYLGTEDTPVSITVAGEDPNQSNELLERVSACTASYGNVCCAAGSAEESAQAQAAGLPLGKYRLYVELQALEPSITVQEVQNMSMPELRDRLAAAQTAAGLPVDTDPSAGDACVNVGSGEGEHSHGNGNGYGYGSGNGNGNSGSNGHGHGHAYGHDD